MKISIEISMYPLNAEYINPIKAFIECLNEHKNVKILTNKMSTQIFGEYEDVLNVLHSEVFKAFQQNPKVVMVMKWINSDLA